ncbi:uncharacterized protein [Euwallacea fornicatus]|uniref:uncharacterized protein n=1 Tax=Euwallacea fornicatus TaxID=995702 RepID=UPI00338EF361
MWKLIETIGTGASMRDQSTQTSPMELVRKETVTVGTQTLHLMEEDKIRIRKINDMLDSDGDLSLLHELVNESWPVQCYAKTTTEKGSILEQERRDLVVICDVGSKLSNLMQELCDTNVQLAKLMNKEGMTPQKMYVLRQHDLLTCEDEPKRSKDTDRITYLCKVNPQEEEMDKTRNILEVLTKGQGKVRGMR